MKRILFFALCLVFAFSFAFCFFASEEGKAELGNLLEETYDSALYVPETFAAYQASAANALDVYLDPAATTEQIDDVLSQLKQAKSGLRPLIDKEKLLIFASDLEQEFIYNSNIVLSEELMKKLTDACAEFHTLYNSDGLTAEAILQAEEKFNGLIEEAEGASAEPTPFSLNSPEEGVVVPEDYQDAQKNTAGSVTKLRTTLVIIGACLFVLGVAAVICYFKPPRFLK